MTHIFLHLIKTERSFSQKVYFMEVELCFTLLKLARAIAGDALFPIILHSDNIVE